MERILSREALIRANGFFRLDERRLGDLLALCDAEGSDEALEARAEAVHGYFFHTDTEASEAHRRFREEPAFQGPKQAAFAAVIMMSGLAHMREVYRERGIPERYLPDSLRDMTIWMDEYEERTGRTGLEEVGWLLRSLRGTLFRIGRLQFIHGPYRSKPCVYVRRADGLPVAFFAEPERLRGDGQADGTNGIYDRDPWESSFRATETEIAGTPIHPGGFAVRRELRLPASEWEPALRPGDGMLDVHIPKDGKMEFDRCRDSILEALRFFGDYFPGKPYRALHLETWFLDAQLQKLLPPDANIVRFQREFYLYPEPSSDALCYERVFGRADIDIETAPEDTSLRRAIKRFVLEGNRMRCGAGLILPGDMGVFGAARYQTRAAGELERLLR